MKHIKHLSTYTHVKDAYRKIKKELLANDLSNDAEYYQSKAIAALRSQIVQKAIDLAKKDAKDQIKEIKAQATRTLNEPDDFI